MTKITIAQLRSHADRARNEGNERLAAEKATREAADRLRLECSALGVVALNVVARYSSLIEDMPSTIDFGADNGYRKGYRAVVKDGVWSLDPPIDRMSISYDASDLSNTSIAVAKACGVAWNLDTSRIFREMVDLPTVRRFPEVWREYRGSMPLHSQAASFAYAPSIAGAFGLKAVNPAEDVGWVASLRQDGIDVFEGLPDGWGSPVARLERGRGRDQAVRTAFSVFRPDRRQVAALVLAFAARRDEAALSCLRGLGIDLRVRGEDGANPLHAAFETYGPADDLSATVSLLVDAGVLEDAGDDRGRTPRALFESAFARARSSDSFDEEDLAHYAEIARRIGVGMDAAEIRTFGR